MAKTVVGSFNSYAEAQDVVTELESSGVPRSDISIVANDATGEYSKTGSAAAGETGNTASAAGKGALAGGAIGGTAGLIAGIAGLAIPGIGPIIAAGPIVAALTGAGIGAAAGGLIGGLTHVGVPEEDAGFYAEAVRRGGALVTVRAEDTLSDRVADIMRRHNANDVDRQAEHWRETGWAGFDANAKPLSADEISHERGKVLPVVEEKLKVGKREVERGGVRVFSHVSERPVEEQVTLREEHARVERRPVDRPASEADLATFKEGTIEVRERAEEAVVSKQPRVTEEVVVGKDTTERTETIRDSVRRTDVDVEQVGRGRTTADAAYREHFESTYGSTGAKFDEYAPAYQYGNSLAERYRGREWDSIESDVQRDWERSNPSRAWDRFKAAIRHGWEATTNAVKRGAASDADRQQPVRR